MIEDKWLLSLAHNRKGGDAARGLPATGIADRRVFMRGSTPGQNIFFQATAAVD